MYLHRLGGRDGEFPFGGLAADGAGGYLGTSDLGGDVGFGSIFQVKADGSVILLHSFGDIKAEGDQPLGHLVRDDAGNFYGTNSEGGPVTAGFGTIFKLDPDNNLTTLYSFSGGADGWAPTSGLTLDADGNVYGTTQLGGGVNGCVGLGCGTVYQLTPTGQLNVLHTFEGGSADGADPTAGVTRKSDGSLYGATRYGGGGPCNDSGKRGCGVIFKISKSGQYTVLHRFAGTDGSDVETDLALDTSGTIYGVATRGGSNRCPPFGCGVLFSLTPAGVFKGVHAFTGKPDGSSPLGLGRFENGQLYGSTNSGGARGLGSIFRFKP